jgi:RNA polymerase-interacting CarD/CdnL/TRCF family regulator
VKAERQKGRAQEITDGSQIGYANVVRILIHSPREMHQPITNKQQNKNLLFFLKKFKLMTV